MQRFSYTVSHPGWYLHDFYWLGALFFMVHYAITLPETLNRRHILRIILPCTLFWFIAYPVIGISALIHTIKEGEESRHSEQGK